MLDAPQRSEGFGDPRIVVFGGGDAVNVKHASSCFEAIERQTITVLCARQQAEDDPVGNTLQSRCSDSIIAGVYGAAIGHAIFFKSPFERLYGLRIPLTGMDMRDRPATSIGRL